MSNGGARFAGLVIDATGGPIPGAVVRATRIDASTHDTISIESDREGRFVLWAFPGPVTWMAEAAGYAPALGSRVAPTSDLVIQMTPASTVSGDVVATSDGKHVAGVQVRAVPKGWSSSIQRSAVSDADGTFSIEGLEPGAYLFVGEGAGWRSESGVSLEVGLADRVDHVVVTVASVAQVSGRVLVSSSGEPCQQGSVSLGPSLRGFTTPYDPLYAKPETNSSNVPSLPASIEPDGSVHFRGVPAGTYHAVVQCTDQLLVEGPTTLEVGATDVDGVLWKVVPGLRLVVHFVDEAAHPVGGAQGRLVFPARRAGELPMPMGLVADTDGRSEFSGALYPGVYTLEADGGYEGQPVSVELREGMGTVDATLRLRGRGSILVKVQTPQGEPVDDVTVFAIASSEPTTAPAAASDAPTPAKLAVSGSSLAGSRPFAAVALGDGRFRIGPVNAGRFRLRVRDGVNAIAPTPEHGLVDVASGAAVETTVTLDRGGNIRGRVLDSSNQPLPDVWVSAECQQATQNTPAEMTLSEPPPVTGAPGRRVLSDAEGRFTLDRLSPKGPCVVRAEQQNGSMGIKRDVRVGDEIAISLPAPGTLGGTAFSARGAPIEHFLITLSDPETGGTRAEEISAPGGRWTIARIRPGALQIHANADGASAMAQAELAPGQTRDDVALEFQGSSLPPTGIGAQ